MPIDSATVRALINAVPENRLRGILTELVLNGQSGLATSPASPTPTRRRRRRRRRRGGGPWGRPSKATASNGAAAGEPKQRAARPAHNEKRRAKRHAAAAAKTAAPSTPIASTTPARRGRPAQEAAPPSANGVEINPIEFWAHAQKIAPGHPWTAVARQLGCNAAQCQDAYRSMTLPPSINKIAAARFLTISPAG